MRGILSSHPVAVLRVGAMGSVKYDPFLRVPHLKPVFTLGQLKKAIPPHCFQRSALRSFWYVALDLTVASILLYMAITFIPSLPGGAFRLVWWSIYWATQGCVLMGVWEIGHECGHHAFADSSLLSDIVGLVLHSVLLTPYFSFKHSHRRHHSNTGSLEHDQVFVPPTRSAIPFLILLFNNPVGRCIVLASNVTIGWSIYLAFNVTGREYPRFASHYDPYSPIFSDRERAQILISDIALAFVAFVLFKLGAAMGFWWVVRVYGVPVLISHGWLVLIASLQHTHPALPRYDSSEWDWLRGTLVTVDRDIGLLNHVFHHFPDTHVVHHLFPTIPHYHAQEATRAIRPLLGEYYHMDPTPIFKALWREERECLYVEPDEGPEKSKGVFWYRYKL